jgi:hypothetical protein
MGPAKFKRAQSRAELARLPEATLAWSGLFQVLRGTSLPFKIHHHDHALYHYSCHLNDVIPVGRPQASKMTC